MLTFEKVLEIFQEYLDTDQALDVAWTKRGYAVMLWDYTSCDWSDVVCCATPEELFDKLLDSFTGYQEYLLTRKKGRIDEADRQKIRLRCIPFLNKRREEER